MITFKLNDKTYQTLPNWIYWQEEELTRLLESLRKDKAGNIIHSPEENRLIMSLLIAESEKSFHPENLKVIQEDMLLMKVDTGRQIVEDFLSNAENLSSNISSFLIEAKLVYTVRINTATKTKPKGLFRTLFNFRPKLSY